MPALSSVAAGDVVAFRWIKDWHQVPVQVDERKPVNFGPSTTARPPRTSPRRSTPTRTPSPAPTQTATSTPTTRSPSWPRTPGVEAPSGASRPGRRGRRQRREGAHATTLGGDTKDGWIYLFKRSGNLDPGAGQHYVNYDFNLLSGTYKTTYKLPDGPEPRELDGHHALLRRPLLGPLAQRPAQGQGRRRVRRRHPRPRQGARSGPGVCGRTEDTFDDAEGAFIANKVGPVRAIRSYIGANSGPLHPARAHLLRAARGHPHVPAGARGPGRRGLLRLLRRRRAA